MSEFERATPALTVETVRLDDFGALIPRLDLDRPLLWQRRGFGLAGLGEAVRLEFSGPTRMTDAASAWQRLVAAATVRDPLARTGTGLLAFGAFAFSAHSARTSVLIVPSVVFGRDPDGSWMTRIGLGELPSVPAAAPFGDEYRISLQPGAMTPDAYRAAVEAAVARIRGGALSKVVLARELVGHLPAGADLRRVLSDLALGYPGCWTFAVDGFFGSSPETLVSVYRGSVTARVLAGSAARGTDAASDEESATALATSTKDQDEHQYAVQSVLAALRAHSPYGIASEVAFTLELANRWHLASDVDGTLTDGSTALDLIASVHPTAAVAGTPTDAALAVIDDLEPFDRGRYAGPVGWIGADGDGEWAIALRSAQLEANGDVTAYAGAGIVDGSDPQHELVETKMKFRPIVEALG
jgi:menaquinone-specific isochorismate synthase